MTGAMESPVRGPEASGNALTPDDLRRLRAKLLRMHHRAGVGHIGGNLSCLDCLAILYLEIAGAQDRIVLSKGHSAGALYVALWAAGRLTDDDLATFHGDASRLPGHPPAYGTPEIPFATGSLGHGVSLAAGLALGMRIRGVPGRVFCVASDGEWQEGSNWEALTFASHMRLDGLTVFVDGNGLQGFGTTRDVASADNLAERFAGFGWEIETLDGHDLGALREAFAAPPRGRPRLLLATTVKGRGVSFMENRMEWHYLPLSDAQLAEALGELEAEGRAA